MRTLTPKLLLTVLTATVLAACATPTARKDESSPFFKVPAGSVLHLHQPIEIRPGSTRTWVQRGRVVRHFDHYWPHCNFEVRKLDYVATQVIDPGRFLVRRTQFLREEVVQRSRPVQLAALKRADAEGGDSPSMIYEGYHLWLDNPEQPNVMRLSCRGVYADPWMADPPSIEEIRAALGAVATLELP